MSRTDRVGFGKYGKSFQEGLIQLIYSDRPFADQITEVLDINFLELEYLKVFVSRIIEYRAKYNLHPSSEAITSILNTDLEKESDVIKRQVRDYFRKIQYNELSDIEYIKEQSLDFCKKQNLKKAMMRSVALLQTSSFDEISKTINDALKLGSDNNFGYDYLADFEERFKPKHRMPVSTGWSEIDSITGGGLGKSELGVVIAPTGAGKSMVLVHLGVEALRAGKNVIHYTLELQDTVVANRYDSCLTGYPLTDIKDFKEEVLEEVKKIEGKLIVKEYPTKSASTNTIKSHLARLKKRGIKPGMIIIDYGDLLRPVVVRKEKRNELESIYEEMRGISTEFSCPVWTASQTNRSGLNAEVITMESISEAFSKCFVADLIFSVSRTIEDKQANTGRVFVAKNRNGPDGMVYPIFMDTSNVSIKFAPNMTNGVTNGNNTSSRPLNPVALTPQMQRDLLQQKYSSLRKPGSRKK
jgi:replicative DNA helicase